MVNDENKERKVDNIDLQDVGEDNLSALEQHLYDFVEEGRPVQRKKSDKEDNQSNNIQPYTSSTPKDDPCIKQEKNQDDSRTKTSPKRCCASLLIGIVILVSLASLFINVLIIKGIIVPGGYQRVDRPRGWYST